MSRVYLLLLSLIPITSFAHEIEKKPIWENLLVASFPILIVIGVFMFFIRQFNKGGKNINERLLESNLEIAKELKRIADHVEGNKDEK